MSPIRRRRFGRRWLEDLPLSPWRWLLLPLWLVFAALSELRRFAYDRRWLTVHRLGVPVISVGNLVAGGAGKTPVAIDLAQRLRRLGQVPMILARGYRAGGDGRNEEAQLAGDIPVITDVDRVRGAATAIARGATVLVLDDGFQHRRLHRDCDVVVIDATRPFGDPAGRSGWMLPLGFRRESLRALRRADLVWLSKADLADRVPRRDRARMGRVQDRPGRRADPHRSQRARVVRDRRADHNVSMRVGSTGPLPDMIDVNEITREG